MMRLLSKVKVCSINTPDQAAETSYTDDAGAPACLAGKSPSFSGIEPHIIHESRLIIHARTQPFHSSLHLLSPSSTQTPTHSFPPTILSRSFLSATSPSSHPDFSLPSPRRPAFIPASLQSLPILPSILAPQHAHPSTFALPFLPSSHSFCHPSLSLPILAVNTVIVYIFMNAYLRNLYAGQEATVRTEHGTTDWFQIGKGSCQGCILSPCLFNLYAEYLMRNAGLEEAQAGIKIAGRNQ